MALMVFNGRAGRISCWHRASGTPTQADWSSGTQAWACPREVQCPRPKRLQKAHLVRCPTPCCAEHHTIERDLVLHFTDCSTMGRLMSHHRNGNLTVYQHAVADRR